MFKSELKNCFVKSVYDKDRKKVKKFEKFLIEGNKSLINFLISKVIMCILQQSLVIILIIFLSASYNKNVIVENHLF